MAHSEFVFDGRAVRTFTTAWWSNHDDVCLLGICKLLGRRFDDLFAQVFQVVVKRLMYVMMALWFVSLSQSEGKLAYRFNDELSNLFLSRHTWILDCERRIWKLYDEVRVIVHEADLIRKLHSRRQSSGD